MRSNSALAAVLRRVLTPVVVALFAAVIASAASIKAHFNYTYTDASFRDGVYAGKEIPLVQKMDSS